jgi:DNA topoisomerase III
VIKEGKTYAPSLLSEQELITLMDKNGIGTDATIHQHIEKILERGYAVKLSKTKLFSPTYVGNFLLEAYKEIGL